MSSLLDHFAGVATETTFGLATTSSMRFLEWTPGSALDSDPKAAEGTGIRTGSLLDRTARRVGVVGQGTGSLQVDLLTRGYVLPLGYSVGTVTSTNVSGSVYQHNVTPALPSNSGTSLTPFTVQEGVVRPDGTTDAYTWAGCAVRSWELACPAGGLVTFKMDVDGKPAHVVRTVTDGVTTNTSAAVTSATAAWTYNDIGRPVTGTGIPASTTIASVESATSATLSAAATATGTGVTFTIAGHGSFRTSPA